MSGPRVLLRMRVMLMLLAWLGLLAAPAPAQLGQRPDPEDLVAKAGSLFRHERYQDALVPLEQARRLDPTHLEAHRLYQDVRLSLGYRAELEQEYWRLAEEHPQDPRFLCLYARVRARPADRVTGLQEARKRAPDLPGLGLELARALVAADRTAEAEDLFQELAAGDPDSAAPRLGLGLLHLRRGDRVAAQQELLRALDIEPDCAPALNHLGRILLLLDPNQQRSVEKLFLRAVQVAPEDFEGYDNLSHLYHAQREAGEAEKWLLRYHDLYPEDTRPLVRLAEIAGSVDAGEFAEEWLNKALEIDEHCAPALVNLAALRVRKRQFAGAEELLRQAIADCPGLAVAYHDLGFLLSEQARFGEAIQLFRTALRCENADTQAITLALARAYAGDAGLLQRKAKELALDPEGDQEQLDDLAARALSRLRAARSAYQESLRQQPGHGGLEYELGKVLYSLGEYEEALVHLQRAREAKAEGPAKQDVYYMMALCFFSRGDLARARSMAEAVIQIVPHHDGAHDLMLQIKRKEHGR